MKMKLSLAAFALGLSATASFADEVTDALNAAQSAYAAGDLNNTAAQLTHASKAVLALQQQKLAAFLPEAPEGWTREVDLSSTEGMAMMGMVGNIVVGNYSDGNGQHISLTLTADSPMVAQMAGMLGNPQMMAMMGKVVKVAGQDMLEQGGSLSALAGGRVLVQAQGADIETLQKVLNSLNFAGLPSYDA